MWLNDERDQILIVLRTTCDVRSVLFQESLTARVVLLPIAAVNHDVIQDISTYLRLNIVRQFGLSTLEKSFHAVVSILLAILVTSARPAWLLLFCLLDADWLYSDSNMSL